MSAAIAIPQQLHAVESWLNWKQLSNGNKSPADQHGKAVGYNSTEAWLPMLDAIEKTKSNPSLHLGISLTKSGLLLEAGYLWCLDFDGFACGSQIDDGLMFYIRKLATYIEDSPSGTGFKAFFVSDKHPQKMPAIKFGVSEFAAANPDVKKYQNRAIEIFSEGRFLAFTGKIFDGNTPVTLREIPAQELNNLLDELNQWALDTGGSGWGKSQKHPTEPKIHAESVSAHEPREYAKPLREDMATVLLYVDAEDEQVYTDTANGLARTYAEDGRGLFLDYCSRSTIQKHQEHLAAGKADERYTRALREVTDRPEGYTCKHIIELAQRHPDWPHGFEVRYENDFEADSNGLFGEAMAESTICHADTLSELFSDMELRQEDVDAMDEAEIIFPNLIVKGHVQAIVSPANGGKTTIMVYVCEKLVATGMEVYYINVDGSPGDLKRHHAHAKQHGYTVLAPDARKGGSIQTIHTKLHALASGSLPLSNAVFVFDTLKKFVQVIDKSKAAAFFKLTRALSVKGATIVLLGHTNKHAGDDGQQVFEGTADLRNDVDELIYLDCYKNEAEGVLEVTTRPDKVRAELQPKTFTIDLNNGRTVRELDYTKNIIAKEKRLVLELFKEAITSGLHSQKDLLDYAEPKTSEGQPKLRKLLKEFASWDKPEIVATQAGRGKDLKYALAVG